MQQRLPPAICRSVRQASIWLSVMPANLACCFSAGESCAFRSVGWAAQPSWVRSNVSTMGKYRSWGDAMRQHCAAVSAICGAAENRGGRASPCPCRYSRHLSLGISSLSNSAQWGQSSEKYSSMVTKGSFGVAQRATAPAKARVGGRVLGAPVRLGPAPSSANANSKPKRKTNHDDATPRDWKDDSERGGRNARPPVQSTARALFSADLTAATRRFTVSTARRFGSLRSYDGRMRVFSIAG